MATATLQIQDSSGQSVAERWGDVPDYPGYRVSTTGRVQTKRHKNGLPAPDWRDMKPVPDGQGYPQVRLYNANGPKWFFVSRLVLTIHVGPPPFPDAKARHFHNPDPWDNLVENLRWGTQAENCADKVLHGTDQRGDRHWRALHAKVQDSGVDETKKAG